jgi:hypothetical protein
MHIAKLLTAILMFFLLCVSAMQAQDRKAEPTKASQTVSQDVMIIIQQQ